MRMYLYYTYVCLLVVLTIKKKRRVKKTGQVCTYFVEVALDACRWQVQKKMHIQKRTIKLLVFPSWWPCLAGLGH